MAASVILQARADQVLRQSPIPALRKLSVEETDHEVVLSGSVSSYYLKQLAQETIVCWSYAADRGMETANGTVVCAMLSWSSVRSTR